MILTALLMAAAAAPITHPYGPPRPMRAAPAAYRDPGQSAPFDALGRRRDPDINAAPNADHRSQLDRCKGKGKRQRDVKDLRCSPGQSGY